MRYRKPGEELKDARSQARKRARAILQELVDEGEREFRCASCGWAPVGELTRSNNLDANHINKNILDDDPANLEWLCRPCHKRKDSQTDKGVSVIEDEQGYNLEGYI